MDDIDHIDIEFAEIAGDRDFEPLISGYDPPPPAPPAPPRIGLGIPGRRSHLRLVT